MILKTKVVETQFGKLYITSWWRDDHLAENERVRIFDENDVLLDYYENDTVEEFCEAEEKSPQQWIDDFADVIKEQDTIEKLLEYLCVEYDYCGTSRLEAAKVLAGGEEYVKDLAPNELDTNEYVAHIGEYIIIMRDY